MTEEIKIRAQLEEFLKENLDDTVRATLESIIADARKVDSLKATAAAAEEARKEEERLRDERKKTVEGGEERVVDLERDLAIEGKRLELIKEQGAARNSNLRITAEFELQFDKEFQQLQAIFNTEKDISDELRQRAGAAADVIRQRTIEIDKLREELELQRELASVKQSLQSPVERELEARQRRIDIVNKSVSDANERAVLIQKIERQSSEKILQIVGDAQSRVRNEYRRTVEAIREAAAAGVIATQQANELIVDATRKANEELRKMRVEAGEGDLADVLLGEDVLNKLFGNFEDIGEAWKKLLAQMVVEATVLGIAGLFGINPTGKIGTGLGQGALNTLFGTGEDDKTVGGGAETATATQNTVAAQLQVQAAQQQVLAATQTTQAAVQSTAQTLTSSQQNILSSQIMKASAAGFLDAAKKMLLASEKFSACACSGTTGGGDNPVSGLLGGALTSVLGFGGAAASGRSLVTPSSFFRSGEDGAELFEGASGKQFFIPPEQGKIAPIAPAQNTNVTVNINGVKDFDSFKKSRGQMDAAIVDAVASGRRNK